MLSTYRQSHMSTTSEVRQFAVNLEKSFSESAQNQGQCYIWKTSYTLRIVLWIVKVGTLTLNLLIFQLKKTILISCMCKQAVEGCGKLADAATDLLSATANYYFVHNQCVRYTQK